MSLNKYIFWRCLRLFHVGVLVLGFSYANTSFATIVDDMLQSGIPATFWYDFDVYDINVVLVPNPGKWEKIRTGVGFVERQWVGPDASGDGASIPAYTKGNYWFQRDIECLPMCNSRLSLYPNLPANGTWEGNGLAVGLAGLLIAPIKQIDQLGLAVHGYAAKSSLDWIYRYTIFNTSSEAKNVEFMISELITHAAQHDEFSFHSANGNFAYDQQPLNSIIDFHNYNWSQLYLDPGSSLVLGFNDTHAPAMATWGIRTDSGMFSEAAWMLPVPSIVSEPSGVFLMFVGLICIARVRLRSRL